MINIIRLNIKDTLKNPTYLFILLITCVVPLNAIIQMAKVYSISNGTSFMLVFTYLALNITIFSFLAQAAISFIVISEKTSGRCEYYLANRANLWTLVKSYCISGFFLCFVPIMIFNFLILAIAYWKSISVIVEVIMSFHFLIFFSVLILFCFFCTLFLTVLTMIARKPEKIRFYLSLAAFANIYITILPMKFLVQKGFTFDNTSIVNLITLTLFMVTCIFGILFYLTSRKLTTEVVVLSYKQ